MATALESENAANPVEIVSSILGTNYFRPGLYDTPFRVIHIYVLNIIYFVTKCLLYKESVISPWNDSQGVFWSFFYNIPVQLLVVVSLIKSYLWKNSTPYLANNIKNVESFLRSKGVLDSRQNSSIWIMILIFTFVLAGEVSYLWADEKFTLDLSKLIFTFSLFSKLILFTVDLTFWSFVRTAEELFSGLGMALKRVQLSDKKQTQVLELLQIYNSLTYICSLINAIFSHQLLITFTRGYIFLNSDLYRIAIYLGKIENDGIALLKVFGSMISICGYLVHTMVIASSCRNVGLKAEKFNKTLYKLAISSRNPELRKNEKLKMHLTMRKPIRFTVCGMFPIDFAMMHSIFASNTMFLVIALQLD